MRRLAVVARLLALALGLFFLVDLEPKLAPPPTGIEVSERARRIHDEAIVIALHVDLAQASPRTFAEALAATKLPPS